MNNKYIIKNSKIVKIEEELTKSNNILVDVLYCGICGTDYQKYIGMPNVEEWGHEIIGIERKSKKYVTIRTTYPCGKCNNCKNNQEEKCTNWKRTNFTGYSNIIEVNKENIIDLNINELDPVYTLVEPLYVANSLIKNIYPETNATYTIIGNGTIGLLAAFLLRKLYNANIRIVGRRNLKSKKEFIKLLNAKYYDIKELNKSLKDSNKIIITAPYNLLPEVINKADNNSNITFNGISKQTKVELDLNTWHFKNLNIYPSFPHPQTKFSKEIELIKENKDILRKLITKIYNLEDIEEAFKELNDKTKDNIKIIIKSKEN